MGLPVSSLRAHLLSSLSFLPGSRTFHLHVLASSSRKPSQSLFLYASPRPKCLVQDILVLLSEQVEPAGAEGHASFGAPFIDENIGNSTPRTFVSAIEASVYVFPTSDSTILYISKVDGTGQGVFPSPTSTLLRAFLGFYASPHSPLNTDHTTRHLWIQLFARSQRQYLFPNSADHPNKKPLGDVALCKWWKKILSDVSAAVANTNNVGDTIAAPASVLIDSAISEQRMRLYYLLPGQSELEASYLLRESQPSSSSPSIPWIYSHPYDIPVELGIPHPSGPHTKSFTVGSGPLPLASLIPHFEDDPKSRFLDELAATSEEQAVAIPVPTPKRKRARVEEVGDASNSTLTQHYPDADERHEKTRMAIKKSALPADTESAGAQPSQPVPPEIMYEPPSSSPAPARERSPPLRPSTPEPTESMHQALLSPHTPNLPTFPVSLLSPHTPAPRLSRRTSTLYGAETLKTPGTPSTPRTPRRPKSDLDTISPADFWERMSYRQECAQGAVTGFFVAVFSQQYHTKMEENFPVDTPRSPSGSKSHTSDPTAVVDTHHILLGEGTVPHSVIKRIMSSLLTGVEFSTVERAHKGTQVIETTIKGLCEGLGYLDSQPPAEARETDDGVTAQSAENPGREVYNAHVYASLSVSNPPLLRKPRDGSGAAGIAAPVNVLGVRRKKKRE